ncbi:methionyl-tRNA formyltransferase [Gallaecimonas pentaromativorans]|uniref:Methionyl-tRNA formyltransferase n=1 Tax=Gallaecimonas pentaromativorans TaxID=584787 RepID=A0A3N1P5X5_9GAMM|nr:formyltransferase family protein [Gallaecimonas pentaromativorans]ROQ22537.1 methionyl-tRNA formyltransferase [Gallaecimonas pentaromativorans]
MISAGFYLLGLKGFSVLKGFVEKMGPEKVGVVCIGKDGGVENDYHHETSSFCKSNNITFYFRGESPKGSANYFFAIGWRWIISDDANLIVLHDSLLPQYRGFSPLVNMLINGESKIGVSAIKASNEYDRGDILGQKEVNITYPVKISDAIDKLSVIYSDLVVSVYSSITNKDTLEGIKQDNDLASYSMWRDGFDYVIDWSQDAERIIRFIDALGSPYLGALTYINGRSVRVKDAQLFDDVSIIDREVHVGKRIFSKDGKPVIICGTGLLLINKAIFEDNGKEIFETIPFRVRFG